jgi:hypothetical protein
MKGQLQQNVYLNYITVLLFLLVFDDGDERTLRRSQLCLKGEKHFIESEVRSVKVSCNRRRSLKIAVIKNPQ